MRLKRLTLENFQGLKSFTLDADCKDLSILGANAAGKTTIFSAFCFLLYGLDSTGKIFLPKSIDETGEAKHGVDSSVEAVFVDDNGQEFTLKKVFKEIWRRKHGSPKKIFTGHSTAHFWDSASITEKEYKRRLTEIAPESVLKLLVNTRYFSETLHWQKRREILLEICGSVSDETIISSNSNLANIPSILDGRTFDERKAMIKSEKAKLNEQLTEIPIRLSENEKGQPDISGLDLPAIEKELSELSKALTLKNEEAARIESGGEIAEKVKKQREIESRLLEIENQISAARNWVEVERRKKVSEFETMQRKKMSDLETAREAEESARGKTERTINNRETDNKAAEQEMAKLRKEWNFVNDKIFDENFTICPTCGQEYPTEEASKIKEMFHVDKAERLREIDKNGRGIGADIVERKDLNETDLADVSLYEERIEDFAKQISEAKAQVPETEKATEKDRPPENKEQESLEFDLAEIRVKINDLKANSREVAEKVKAEIDTLHDKRILTETRRLIIETHKKGQKRIVELGNQQRLCAKEFEELEEQLYIMDLFLREKVKLLEEKVNSKFTMARFKLFEVQVNSALNEVCEVTYDGISWNSGLNTSMKVNLGIDLINTLSEHFGLTLPLFIDGCESITKTIPCNSQLIKLIVDADYPELTVKIDE